LTANPNEFAGQTSALVGHYFLSEPDLRRRVHASRGRIVSVEATGVYLVELHSWLDGEPFERTLVRLDEMGKWTFFDSAKSCRERGDEIQALAWQNASTAGEDGD
jgi:hypothetical protein